MVLLVKNANLLARVSFEIYVFVLYVSIMLDQEGFNKYCKIVSDFKSLTFTFSYLQVIFQKYIFQAIT